MSANAAKQTPMLATLPGRPAFERTLEQMLANAKKAERSVAIALWDLDLFGAFNKKAGHGEGDRILEAAAAFIAHEAPDTAALYRFGGDAFAVLLEGIEKEQAFLRMEQMREHFARVFAAESAALTLSGGLAAFPDDGVKTSEVIQKASEALYRAKVNGRNKLCLAREENMATKTSHYTQGQLLGLRRLAEREGIGEAVLLREALNDLLRKYNA